MRRYGLSGHRPSTRLSARHERWLYVVGGALLLSGLGWLVGHYLLAGSRLADAFQFAGNPHPSEVWWLRVHGGAMLGFLVAFGALLPRHVVYGWRGGQNKRSGIFLLAIVVALVLTGYGLYYLDNEATRPWMSAAHWLLGIGAAAGLVLHVILGKRSGLPTNIT